MQFASKWVATLLFSAVQPIYVYSVIKSVKFCGSSGCDNLAEKLVVMAAPGTLSLVWLCCLIYFVRSISGWTQILLPSATGVVFFFGAALVLGDMNSGTKPPNAEIGGAWSDVFLLMAMVCVLGIVLGIIGSLFSKIVSSRKANKQSQADA